MKKAHGKLSISIQIVIILSIFCSGIALSRVICPTCPGAPKHVIDQKIDINSESYFLPSELRRVLEDSNSTNWDDSYVPKILPTPSIWKFGLIPSEPSLTESASVILEQIQSQGTNINNIPLTWDNSQNLPPVANQMDQNSCSAWAIGYYLKSFHVAHELQDIPAFRQQVHAARIEIQQTVNIGQRLFEIVLLQKTIERVVFKRHTVGM